MQKQALSILIYNYENKIINVTKFIVMNLYFSKNFENNNSIFVEILMKMHFIKNLKINILIDTNSFTLYKFLLNCVS